MCCDLLGAIINAHCAITLITMTLSIPTPSIHNSVGIKCHFSNFLLVMLYVIILSVVKLNVITQSVEAPFEI